MFYEVSSNSTGNTSELTVLMKIRAGNVDRRLTMTYATRLRSLLYTFNGLRQTAYEARLGRTFAGATEAIRALHAVRWMIIDQDTRLLLTVNFDSPKEPYLRRIVDTAGDILDAILCHCEGYENFSTDLGYKQFAKWVANNQEECEFFYTATPDFTVDDFNYLREQNATRTPSARLRAPTPQDLANRTKKHFPEEEVEQGLSALEAFYRLVPSFLNTGNRKHAVFLYRATHLALGDGTFLKRVSPAQAKRYAKAVAWFTDDEPQHEGPVRGDPPAQPEKLEQIREDLQGNVLSAYEGMTHGCIALLRVVNRNVAAAWLKNLKLTLEVPSKAPELDYKINIAFTYNGLRRCGVPKEELARLPTEFREGMEDRAGLLGDMRFNHPDQWERPRMILDDNKDQPVYGDPIRFSSIDILLTLQKRHADSTQDDHQWSRSHPLYNELHSIISDSIDSVHLVAVQPLRRPLIDTGEKVVGHFGFLDGISKTTPVESPTEGSQSEIPLGELLLGHVNSHKDPLDFGPGELPYNGSFLVLRKIEQDVVRFDDFLDQGETDTGIARDTLAAKLVGRAKDGTLPHLPSQPEGSNEWNYDTDEELKVPLQSHIRRSNPRGSSSIIEAPRIVRRGFMYGPIDNQQGERGLVFMALNASIAEQFETVQRWCAGGNSCDGFSGDADPLLGVGKRNQPRHFHFLHKHQPYTLNLNTDRSGRGLTTLKWGLYALVPSLEGTRILADIMSTTPARNIDELELRVPKPRSMMLENYGELVIDKLPPNHKIWKIALEDPSARGAGITEGIWSYAEKEGGAYKTASGVVLVTAQELVEEVLDNNGETYSTRLYWDRLNQAQIGDGYIGMDPYPTGQNPLPESDIALNEGYINTVPAGRYQGESEHFNQRIAKEKMDEAYGLAFSSATTILDEDLSGIAAGEVLELDLESFIDMVLARLSSAWFGIPFDAENNELVDTFAALAGYVFNPEPADFLIGEGHKAGPLLVADAEKNIPRLRSGAAGTPALLKDLYDRTVRNSTSEISTDEDFIRTLVGVTQGFLGPTRSTFLSTMGTLQSTDEFWRAQVALQQALDHPETPPTYDQALGTVKPSLELAMYRQPVPEIVYRKAVRDGMLGSVEVKSGDLVVVSLRRWSEHKGTDALFGGAYKQTTHACPGKPMGMGVLLGVLTALLLYKTQPGSGRTVIDIIKRGES